MINYEQRTTNNEQLKLIECPRDAMQGLEAYIPTQVKADYINALLRVGFDTIDFGSFVSPKAIPQLKDTAEVIRLLDLSGINTKLLSIIANQRGAEAAVGFDEITYLGFPHAVSPTFLKLNINSTPEKAIQTIDSINNLCITKEKQLVVYLSLAFGNPYNEEWNLDLVINAIEDLRKTGIKIIILADTLGDGNKERISSVFKKVISLFQDIEFGFHLHTTPDSWYEKVDAAFKNGCRRFDSVMLGLGGCPMASKDLTGNLSTKNLLHFFETKNITLSLNTENYKKALGEAKKVFSDE